MGINTVFVTNTNDFVHTDRYDSEEFVFPPHVQVAIPIDAAVHMLGYKLEDKTETLVRLGWAMKYDAEKKNYVEDEEGVRKLANFTFDEATMVPKSSRTRELTDLA